jgi:DNA-binding LacI/PurR family transcriptional regulator
MSTHLAGKQQKLFKNVPTAVMAYSHSEAIELRHALWQNNVAVPQDISLATFNDVDPLSMMTPPLTTIDVPAAKWDGTPVSLLLNMMKDHAASKNPTSWPPKKNLSASLFPKS